MEIKSYRVTYEKRIILRAGEDTIPFGYHWKPDPTIVLPVCRAVPSVPDHVLRSQVLPHVVEEEAPQEIFTQMRADVESFFVSDDDNREIDLMDTDDESDTDYQSENDDDRNWVRIKRGYGRTDEWQTDGRTDE